MALEREIEIGLESDSEMKLKILFGNLLSISRMNMVNNDRDIALRRA